MPWSNKLGIFLRARGLIIFLWGHDLSWTMNAPPILVVLIMYHGATKAWGMHFPGIQIWASFGCEDSTSLFVHFLPSVSYSRYSSLRCSGGSKDDRRAREFSGSFAATLR
jgi:hypothetical protein